jgi:rhodanese-related sulfurtransferase
MQSLLPSELKAMLDAPGSLPILVDVREPWEHEICHIDGCQHIPMASLSERIKELDPKAKTVVICHHGIRSLQVAKMLEQAGFTDVANLKGGIDIWAREVEPEMVQY